MRGVKVTARVERGCWGAGPQTQLGSQQLSNERWETKREAGDWGLRKRSMKSKHMYKYHMLTSCATGVIGKHVCI